MEVRDFTNDAEIEELLLGLKRECGDMEYSDIIDQRGHQYVDFVMAGGGVLGIALIGFTYILEEMGIRFLRVGGTSAGSINAILLAGLGTPDEAKSTKLIAELANLNFWSFVDGGHNARKLVQDFVQHKMATTTALDVALNLPHLTEHLGLNPGAAFTEWLSGLLQRMGVGTTEKLMGRMGQVPADLIMRDGTPIDMPDPDSAVAIIAADITTESKITFPKMASLYWDNPSSIDPAWYVRASMSIPFFFEPFMVDDIPQGPDAMRRWIEFAGVEGDWKMPKGCRLVDGGILSNFPINIFHDRTKVPSAPTFGVKLGSDRRCNENAGNMAHLAWSIFDSSRHCLDYDFVANNLDYRNLVACINTDPYNWLDFEVADEEKLELFTRGAKAACKFLKDFNWANYKDIRGKIADAQRLETVRIPTRSGQVVHASQR
jgi:NTE family protein